MSKQSNPVCSVCGGLMLAGVVPIEPRWWCPNHPDGVPVTSRTPSEAYTERLEEFATLKPDWDSYGGLEIDPGAREACRVFLEAVLDGSAWLVPTRRGGVQIEVHTDDVDVEVEIGVDTVAESARDIMGFWERKP